MSDLKHLNALITRHLNKIEDNVNFQEKWQVNLSKTEGRGLITVKDIQKGDLVFVDHALLMGPRTAELATVGCVVCYVGTSRICDKKCGLLVCSKQCEECEEHSKECDFICSWKPLANGTTIDSTKFVKNIVPLRSLILDDLDKLFILQLAYHASPKHGSEVRFLKEHFEISKPDEKFMMRTCYVLDANAYEMFLTTSMKNNVNLRGLFPVAALLNHNCRPNVRCDFDSKGKMYVRATKLIPAGEEIFTSYTGILWGNTLRRTHLKFTKEFICMCDRCLDKTEAGSFLGALKCLDKKCEGVMLPIDSVSLKSDWCCELCQLQVTSEKVNALQSAIAGFLTTIKLDNPEDMYSFLETRLQHLLPATNNIVLEFKLKIVSNIGETENYKWKELSTQWLSRVETLCRDLLHPYKCLGLQQTTQYAKILLLLHLCLLHKLRNVYHSPESEQSNVKELEKEVQSTINDSYEVLRYEIFADEDLELRKDLANADIRKLIQYHEDH